MNHHGGRLLGNVLCICGLLLQSLYYEERSGNGIGAGVAESVLGVTERILQEASSSQKVLVRTISQEVRRDACTLIGIIISSGYPKALNTEEVNTSMQSVVVEVGV